MPPGLKLACSGTEANERLGIFYIYMSHIMRKNVLALCEQRRCRSACASAQSDQRLCFHCLDSVILLVSISEISSLYLTAVAAQAGLCLLCSQTPKTGFLMTRLILYIATTAVTLSRHLTTKVLIRLHRCAG